MPLTSGELDRRIRIERNTPTRDGHGNDVPAWGLLSAAWAKFMPGSAQERREAAADRGTLTAVFRIRRTSRLWPASGQKLGPKDRIIFDGLVWDVNGAVTFGLDGLDVTATTGFASA